MTNYAPQGDWRIRINGNETHPVPHVHVVFRDGSRVTVAIATGEVLAGMVVPLSRLHPALRDIEENGSRYLAEYRRLNP